MRRALFLALVAVSCGGVSLKPGFDWKYRQCPCEDGYVCNTAVLPPYCRPEHSSKEGDPCVDSDNCAVGLYCRLKDDSNPGLCTSEAAFPR